MEIFPPCRAKVCQDEEIDSWLLITKVILPLLLSFYYYIPLMRLIRGLARNRSFLPGGVFIGEERGRTKRSGLRLTRQAYRGGREKLLRDNGAIWDPQLFHELRN